MIPAPLHPKEKERVEALLRYEVLYTPGEQAYDDLVQLASYICDSPISLVSLITADEQWFKAKVGIDAERTSRDLAFCSHAILEDGIFEVQDALEDERFFDNPFVTDGPKVRFYAGAPLVTSEGLPLGTLCVIDDKPKSLRPDQKSALKAMSRQVIDQLELRLKTRKLANSVMQKDKFFSIIAHDLRSPLSYMYSITQMLQSDLESLQPEQIQEFASILNGGCEDLLELIEKVMEWSKSEQGLLLFREEEFSIQDLIVHILRLLKPAASKKNIELFVYNDGETTVKADKNMITFAIRNLINNAIKFTHSGGIVKILSEQEGDHVKVVISDTGTGISAEKLENLFSIGNNKSANGTAGEMGSGIGLPLTKEFIERNGSELIVKSTPGKGSTFSFTLPLAEIS